MERSFMKDIAVFLMAALLLTAVMGGTAAVIQYQDYREKMEIIYTVTGAELTEKDGQSAAVGAAVRLLKGGGADTASGEKLLGSYGYDDRIFGSAVEASYYLRRLYASWAVTAAVCLVMYGFLCILYIFRKKREEMREQKRFNEIAAVLSDLQAGDYSSVGRKEALGDDSAAEILYTRLNSLAEHLRFTHAAAHSEKEATKSLVTDLSHQLKTPVAALGTSLEILQQPNLTEEERQEFTERCLVQKDRLKELLDALINISRLESGMIEIKLRKSNIFDTVAAAVSRIYPIASRKQIEISVEHDEGAENLRISQDKKWLCEALLNVLENAVKYSPEKSEIRIRLVRRISFLRIEIEDEGIGIPQESRHLVFRRFWRGTSPEVRGQSGSGVGLYLSRQIIESHGGTIRTAQASAGGSIFIIQLPYEDRFL